MTEAVLTTSWDDGHPLDLRLAERLSRHGVAATFYCPITNCEGRAVMTAAELRELAAAGFEIGAHTLDHRRLDHLSADERLRQISLGKTILEDRLGQAVVGFCYPGGRGVGRSRDALIASGLRYGRTTQMLRLEGGDDAFARPTSLQLFPHGPTALMRNWVRQGLGWDRLRLAGACLRQPDLAIRLEFLLDEAIQRGGLLHLWGHSWEIEALGLWPLLDDFLTRAAARIPPARRQSNGQAFGATPCAS